MMNVFALGLVLTSLVTAGFFSPSPQNHNPDQDVIVKEGHRVVVVEFEKDDGNTKVLISPQDSHTPHKVEDKVFDKLSERTKDASSTVDEEDIVNQEEEIQDHHTFSARELVCDAYGKCKHKIASAIGITKEKGNDLEEETKEAVNGVMGVAKDTAQKASDKAQETKESMSEIPSRAKDKVTEIKEGAKKQASNVIEDANEKMEGVKEKVSDEAKEAGEMVENVKDRVEKGAREGKKELGEILQHAREVGVDIFRYVAPRERVASIVGILHLMGFSAAYGMCVWVTFASSYVLTNALPRNQFATVQSKVYPVYFKAMAYSLGMALLGHLFGERKKLAPFGVGTFQGLNLLASLVMNLVNMLYLEPRATKVMFERMKKEKEEGREKEGHTTTDNATVGGVDSIGEIAGRVTTTMKEGGKEKPEEVAAAKSEIIRLSEVLRRLNSYSSFLNVLTLMSLTWHLVHLGQRLHTVCLT
ncbi:hypothetical protein ACJIZ3_003056 [Penstemon smallii]|uniref:TMEM205-like domain-containing protein n=1 Tax=Penstemon smallii TaxID=265156 RepID=A0ABD3UB13_9LAMI